MVFKNNLKAMRKKNKTILLNNHLRFLNGLAWIIN
jgi:hypothetical protein